MSKKNHVYDYVIVGSGLSGLAAANAIQKMTSNYIILDCNETFGGYNRTINSSVGPINNGLRSLPHTDLTEKAVRFLSSLLEEEITLKEIEDRPVTFEDGSLKEFLGFGNNPPAFYEEIYPFSQQRVQPSSEPHEWTQKLYAKLTGEFQARHYVTKFIVEDETVKGVWVNGQKQIFGHNFIYAAPVKFLKTLMPESILGHKAMQKLAKNTYWTAVHLDLFHENTVTDSKAMHILNGTTQDEIGPCAGLFQGSLSQWITFVGDEEADDTEIIGHALKKIKRQIKRAYPEALDKIQYERILVMPSVAGNGDLKVSANLTLPNASNVWIASAQMQNTKGVVASLLQAELVAASLGCHPDGVKPLVSQTESQPEMNL